MTFFTHCSTVFTFQYFFQVNRFYVSLNVLFIGTYIVVLFTLSNWFLHAAFFLLQPLIWWRCILIFIFSWVMMHLARLPSQTVNNCRGIVNFLHGMYVREPLWYINWNIVCRQELWVWQEIGQLNTDTPLHILRRSNLN